MTGHGTGGIPGVDTGDAAGEAFWTFALDLYARHDVTRSCIELQDEHGLDVPLLLLACWLGERGVMPDRDWWAASAAASAPWREQVVAPLRAVRRYLKLAQIDGIGPEAIATLRTDVAASELTAERLAMLGLGRSGALLPAAGETSSSAIRRNLEVYATSQHRSPEILAQLLASVAPQK